MSKLELTACPTSPSARSSSTERVSSCVRSWSSLNKRTFSMAITATAGTRRASDRSMITTARSGLEPSGTNKASFRFTSCSACFSPAASSTPLGTTSSFMRSPASSALTIIGLVPGSRS
jgi:hypothetical protein